MWCSQPEFSSSVKKQTTNLKLEHTDILTDSNAVVACVLIHPNSVGNMVS